MRNENRYVFPKDSLEFLLKAMSNSGLENIRHTNMITQTIYFDRSSLTGSPIYLRTRSYLPSFSGQILKINSEFDCQLEYKMEGQPKVSIAVETGKLVSAILGVGLLNQFKLISTGATEWLRQHFK